MRDEVKAFVASVARLLAPVGPVVEIGALQTPGQEGYADLRPLFPEREYLGCDLVAGPGVDRIEDVRALSFADGAVGTVLAIDSLEHVADPYHAVAEMRRVLAAGRGLLLVGTPFIFPVHHHPDFTRFTPEGMARLLSAFPDVGVFSIGDAQWPHSIVAVAGTSGDAGEFATRMAAVVHDWETSAAGQALVPFHPVESILRSHDLFPAGAWVRPGEPREDVFTCAADDLARIDVRLGVEPTIKHGTVRLSVHPEHGDAAPVAEAFVAARCLGEPRWMAFQFPPLRDSGGRRYRVRLSVDDGAVIAYDRADGGLVFEAYRRRPPEPHAAAIVRNGDGALVRQVDDLTAQVRGLEDEIVLLRRLLAAERAVPWWRRIVGRGRRSG